MSIVLNKVEEEDSIAMLMRGASTVSRSHVPQRDSTLLDDILRLLTTGFLVFSFSLFHLRKEKSTKPDSGLGDFKMGLFPIRFLFQGTHERDWSIWKYIIQIIEITAQVR